MRSITSITTQWLWKGLAKKNGGKKQTGIERETKLEPNEKKRSRNQDEAKERGASTPNVAHERQTSTAWSLVSCDLKPLQGLGQEARLGFRREEALGATSRYFTLTSANMTNTAFPNYLNLTGKKMECQLRCIRSFMPRGSREKFYGCRDTN